MTGYGKVTKSRNGKNIEVEIRSLNSKTLDVHTKLPLALNSKDLDIRAMIAAGLERGKVDLNITLTTDATEDNLRINEQLLEAYFRKTVEIARKFGVEIDQSLLLTTLLRFPDVQKVEQEEEIEDEWALTREAVEESIKQLNEFRIQEGQNLKNDFIKRVNLILSYLDEVEPLANARVGIIRERILQRFEELKGTVDVDSNRLEQELIFYIEKLDITEEKVRLRNHCRYFIENIDADESTGKKLGFIAQEMGREINTLGSKANDAEIQKIVVKMKDELEKIKEQVLNIL
ncbi:MAG: YicC family protein [Bacteroidales bacterium]|nr:YicC family protein [Bacteroidales bacterium]MBQ5551571.1 YicC family protein [Bacteroidales bacterium]MBR4272604.1 YicC family protein [Bacteroidales bacterium]